MRLTKFTDLADEDKVAVFHACDYFGMEDTRPYCTPTTTLKEFKDKVLAPFVEDDDEDLDIRDMGAAFSAWDSGSGDGGETYTLLCFKDGHICAVDAGDD